MSFSGSCHCGQIRFECADEIPSQALTCNCSICHRKGSVLHFTNPDDFQLQATEEVLKAYQFNRHIITHYFCSNCGSGVFAKVEQPGQPPRVAINLRCSDVPLSALEIQKFDGAGLL